MKKEVLHWQLPGTHLTLCGNFIHVAKCTPYKNRITCPTCLSAVAKLPPPTVSTMATHMKKASDAQSVNE